ncbi:LON peptidase substrate-binding domain-containing protein [Guyparkeria hydrothermalis]|uniref:LON peptidase substrate-binding domain-containing protein n=1 Tax=Guyparkeria hydrothermalis TaxID=923 RepID=UPI0020216270|nr:LON peptidase substrate-binding domain-containing protein [Guyparkeria hydrothermalis]MCL7744720.1 LON peptidase substrate-binding domain-containing protein [Guyparkeria hydrothermalis]
MATDEAQLPLFPLRAVLYPGGELPLRIFEARYLDLVRWCLRHDRPFGVVLITEGREVGLEDGPPRIAGVGTTARVADANVLAGGLLGVRAQGESRFRVVSHQVDDRGLVQARVENLAAGPSSGDSIAAERHEQLIAALKRLEPTLCPDESSELTWLCCRLAERLPLGLPARQALLECESVEAMVAHVEGWLAGARR